jgi:multidrug transporter EmrE-like cation transporter
MITAVYAAARVMVMVFGWLLALTLGLAVDSMLTGAKWPIFIGIGAWWTLIYSLMLRREVERMRVNPASDALARR